MPCVGKNAYDTKLIKINRNLASPKAKNRGIRTGYTASATQL